MTTEADALVLGGGIAGLAAAYRLAMAGRSVVMLEARDRLGGRLHTVSDPDTGHPVELGAEFVHGHPAGLTGLIRSAGLALDDVPERHRRGPGERGPPLPDLRGSLARLLHGSDTSDGALGDRPVAELLRRHPERLPDPATRRAVVRYLEGFHAADLDHLGTRALAENEATEDEEGDRPHRIHEGYGALVAAMTARLDPARVALRLETMVTALAWKPGGVRATARLEDGSPVELRARHCVVALPLPALLGDSERPGAISIDPVPAGWPAALRRLHMGAAHHVVLGFEERWWAADSEDPAFVHGDDEPFPIWWTALPSRAPLITGWAGGPRAEALAGRSRDEIVALALDSLASVFGCARARLESLMRGAWWHDWSADPFAAGAYSYGGVGAIEARALLVRPVGGTLALAGEAVAEGGRNGTVQGALESGRRAAAALLRDGGEPERDSRRFNP